MQDTATLLRLLVRASMDIMDTTTATMGMVRVALGLPLVQELVGMEVKALDRAQALAVAQAVGMARAALALAQALVVLAHKELELVVLDHTGLDHMGLDHKGLEVVVMARAAMVLTLVQVLVDMEAKVPGLVQG